METVWSTEQCPVCEAKLRPSEVTKHVVACITLSMASMPNLVATIDEPALATLGHYCRYIHLKDQEETALREQGKHPDDHLPGTTTPTPAMERYKAWMREQREGYHPTPGQTFPVPEGKKMCHLCNGITHMYPNCIGCDGKGYVD